VAGTWTGEQISPRGKFGFRLELTQVGPRLTGTFLSNDEYDGKKRSRVYVLSGKVYHNHVFLEYQNKEAAQVGIGAFLFAIRDAGDELFGSMLFFRTGAGTVGSSDELRLLRSIS